MGKEFGKRVSICITESLCYPLETNITLSINYAPIKKKKIVFFKEQHPSLT